MEKLCFLEALDEKRRGAQCVYGRSANCRTHQNTRHGDDAVLNRGEMIFIFKAQGSAFMHIDDDFPVSRFLDALGHFPAGLRMKICSGIRCCQIELFQRQNGQAQTHGENSHNKR